MTVGEILLKRKIDLADVMIGFIENLKNKYNLQVQYLHCNNAGENDAFKNACKQEGMGDDFEYSAPGTPQQNNSIKRKFVTLFNRVCAMLNGNKINAYLWNAL